MLVSVVFMPLVSSVGASGFLIFTVMVSTSPSPLLLTPAMRIVVAVGMLLRSIPLSVYSVELSVIFSLFIV